MKVLLVAAILLLVPARLGAQADPVPLELPLWAAEVHREKPYVLELAYAATSNALPPVDPGGGAVSPLTVTEGFLKEAKRIRIGVSSAEAETIETGDGCRIIYRLQRAGAGFTLQIFLLDEVGGTRMINTRVALSEAQWVVLGGHFSESGGGDRTHFYVAIRIETRR